MADQEHFGDYQLSIYLQGAAGETPEVPVSPEDLETRARENLSAEAFDYVAGSAGSEDTRFDNATAFRRWRIVPRMLRDVARRDYRTSILGTETSAPLMLAPVGVLGIVHPEGELAVARATATLGIPLILSTLSSHTLEEVAEAAGPAPRWFQLYWPRDQELAASLIRRAESAAYTGLVITVDTRLMGWRERDLKAGYLPFLRGRGLANYFSDRVFRDRLEAPPEEDLRGAVMHWADVYSDPGQTWEDLDTLRELTSLPLILKGLLHPDDARRAVEAGVDAIVVSNHGGRQVDGAIAALDALPGIVDAAGDDLTILFDSGIRRGADMMKALALGSDAVLLGRPYVWGLAVAGEKGVRAVLRHLLAEFDLTMALSGRSRLDELTPEVLVRA